MGHLQDMSDMKHTKGEWYKRAHCHLTDLNIVVFPIIKNARAEPVYRNAIATSKPHAISGILIANAYGKTKEEAEANAKLIAQSPVMYTFIVDYIDAMEDKGNLSIHETALLDSAKQIVSKLS